MISTSLCLVKLIIRMTDKKSYSSYLLIRLWKGTGFSGSLSILAPPQRTCGSSLFYNNDLFGQDRMTVRQSGDIGACRQIACVAGI